MPLESLVDSADDPLHSIDRLDVLLLYAVIADANRSYLEDLEIASNTNLHHGPALIKRESALPALTVARLADSVDVEFLRLRNEADERDPAETRSLKTSSSSGGTFCPETCANSTTPRTTKGRDDRSTG